MPEGQPGQGQGLPQASHPGQKPVRDHGAQGVFRDLFPHPKAHMAFFEL